METAELTLEQRQALTAEDDWLGLLQTIAEEDAAESQGEETESEWRQ